MTWKGDIPAASTLTIDYQVRVAPGIGAGDPLCIVTSFDNGAEGTFSITECTTVDCPPTAADLRSFHSIGLGTQALLVWETAGEAGTLGFNLYRSATLAGPWLLVNPALVPGRGTAAAGADYLLRDAPGSGRFLYRLEEVDSNGKRSQLATIEVQVGQDATGRQVFMPRAVASGLESPAEYRS